MFSQHERFASEHTISMFKTTFGLSAFCLAFTTLVSCAPTTQSTASQKSAAVNKSEQKETSSPQAVKGVAKVFKPVPVLNKSRIVKFQKAEQVIDPAKQYRALLKTSKGNVLLELDSKAAPVAVNNFVFLALNNFYTGTRFHRVIEGFMAQGGDHLSADLNERERWGTGGPGYQFKVELENKLRFDQAGILGMARSASYSSQGGQFFITLAPADFLSGEYTIFGKVLRGQDVVDKLTRNYTNNGPIPNIEADMLNEVQILVNDMPRP